LPGAAAEEVKHPNNSPRRFASAGRCRPRFAGQGRRRGR